MKVFRAFGGKVSFVELYEAILDTTAILYTILNKFSRFDAEVCLPGFTFAFLDVFFMIIPQITS